MSEIKLLSLYDYLGRAAGSQLGKQVASYAKIRKTKYGSRKVSNPSFQGDVLLYTKEFLDEFFAVQKIFSSPDYTEINTLLEEDLMLSETKEI